MITPDKALTIIPKCVRPLKAASMAPSQATGFCLAEDVRADRDMPPAERSAMDG